MVPSRKATIDTMIATSKTRLVAAASRTLRPDLMSGARPRYPSSSLLQTREPGGLEQLGACTRT